MARKAAGDPARARMAGPNLRRNKTEQEWAERAARHLKAELKRADVTYDELAQRLEKYGFGKTKASIANKFARASHMPFLFSNSNGHYHIR